MIENERQLKVTQQKLAVLEERIAAIKQEPPTPVRDRSLQSLMRMRKQMHEESIRFRAHNPKNSPARPS